MTIKTLLGAAALALSTAAPVAAVPINLDFTFHTAFSGTFYGLDNADGTSAASSFDYVGSYDSYSGVTTSFANVFTFSGGLLTDVDFSVFDSPGLLVGDTPSGNIRALDFGFLVGDVTECDRNCRGSFGGNGLLVSYTQQPISAVPLPAGSLLLLSGLFGVAVLKRRKKHAA